MTWIPGLIVLAIGLAAGALVARGFQRARSAKGGKGKKTRRPAGLELRITDLDERRDELYERLREIERGEGPEEDRATLELAAARTLRELDQLEGDLAKAHPKAARERKRAHDAEPDEERDAATTPAASPGRHFVTGFAYGAGLLILVGGLIYWAVRDAQPRPDQGGPMAGAPSAESPHPETSDLPPTVASRVASLSSFLETEPDDLDARKELAYTYLGSSKFVEAYGQSEEILARASEDPDGLYIQGIVRLTMGQVQMAEELLGRALASDPNHVDSLTATGIISLQMGDYQTAIATWKRGLEAIGGSNEMIERLIRLAEEGRSPEEILSFGAPPPEPEREMTAEEILGLDPAPAEPRPAAAPAPAPPAPAAALAPDAVTLTLDLAPGAAPVPGSILYVTLRAAGGGPPIAVKRVDAWSFPMTVTLDQADSMMGAPIPESGQVTARLDVDGSASTRSPGDLEASGEAKLGEALTLRLSSGS